MDRGGVRIDWKRISPSHRRHHPHASYIRATISVIVTLQASSGFFPTCSFGEPGERKSIKLFRWIFGWSLSTGEIQVFELRQS